MSDDHAFLREKARELIRTRLSSRRPDRVWGGRGVDGIRCMLCGATVTHDEMVLEVKFTGEDDAGPVNPHFHVRCFSALELELRTPEAGAGGTSPPGDQTQSSLRAFPAAGFRRQGAT
jgi:hypothetical protein